MRNYASGNLEIPGSMRSLSSGAHQRDPLASPRDDRWRGHLLLKSGITPLATSRFQMNSTSRAPMVAVMKPAP
jgi:hypothetical protein